MRTLFLDCSMGAAGDMLNAALFDMLAPQQKADYLAAMNSLEIEGLSVSAHKTEKCGIAGTHISVTVDGLEEHEHLQGDQHSSERNDTDNHGLNHEHARNREHAHHHASTLADVIKAIEAIGCSSNVTANATEVYSRIAEAESEAHGTSVEHIHFHEVGTADAIADVVGFCLLMDMISPDHVVCSPINVGSGTVKCAHGVLPLPAPATASILKGIPTYSDGVKGELCTPTGAAILSVFANEFSTQPMMAVERIGHGCGTKDFERANIVRAMLGESSNTDSASNPQKPNAADSTKTAQKHTDEPAYDDFVSELSCNVDDMTGEEIAYTTETLLEEGALDVFTTAISMKKGRPATKISCLVKPEAREHFAKLMLKHTTTIGVRCVDCGRFTMKRETIERETVFGNVRFKRSEGHGVTKEKPEFDDVAKIASETGLSAHEVKIKIAHNE